MLIADEEIWDTRNTSEVLRSELVAFDPLNISIPASPTRGNISALITDPSWNFGGPVDCFFNMNLSRRNFFSSYVNHGLLAFSNQVAANSNIGIKKQKILILIEMRVGMMD